MCLPDSLDELSDITFLETDSYLPYDKEVDLFLLLNKLFGETYLVVGDEWDYDEDDWDDEDNEDEDDEDEEDWDEDESGEVNGSKSVRLYTPDGFKKCSFGLTFHEMLDMGGGSNGADVDFDTESGIKEEKLDKQTPSDSFVEEMLVKATEKGYTELINLIKEKVGK